MRDAPPPGPSGVALWRRRSLDVLTSEVVAGRARGPEPPRTWAARLRQLVDASRRAEAGPVDSRALVDAVG